MNFEPSQKSQDYLKRVTAFMGEHVLPIEQAFFFQAEDGIRDA